MRSNIVHGAQSAARAVRGTRSISHTPAPTIPYICASCRRAAITQRTGALSSTASSKTFATSIPRERPVSTTAGQQDSPATAVPQTHYDFFPQTFPSGPPPASPFTPDLKQLRIEFLQLQAKAHPDLHPTDHKRHAEALSSRINEAYKTLQDPLKRAQYLLLQRGVDVEDESAKMSGGELLMEVMEAREAVEEAESEEEVAALRGENSERIEESVQVLENAFANAEWDAAALEAVRLRYWVNIGESIHGWERGKGGGVIHH